MEEKRLNLLERTLGMAPHDTNRFPSPDEAGRLRAAAWAIRTLQAAREAEFFQLAGDDGIIPTDQQLALQGLVLDGPLALTGQQDGREA